MSAEGARDVLCASDPLADQLERLQIELGEGPAVSAGTSLAPVLVTDLARGADEGDQRWPFFAARADELGVGSLFAFPIRVNDVSVGTLSLHRRTPGPLASADLGRALAAIGQIGDVFLDVPAPTTVEDVRTAQVHQAAGMTMIQLGVSIGEAMALLRAAAYAEGISLTNLAADVVHRRRRMSDWSDT